MILDKVLAFAVYLHSVQKSILWSSTCTCMDTPYIYVSCELTEYGRAMSMIHQLCFTEDVESS